MGERAGLVGNAFFNWRPVEGRGEWRGVLSLLLLEDKWSSAVLTALETVTCRRGPGRRGMTRGTTGTSWWLRASREEGRPERNDAWYDRHVVVATCQSRRGQAGEE